MWDDALSPAQEEGRSLGLVRGEVGVLVNFDAADLPLPEGAEVLLASGPLGEGGVVPSDTTVWFRRS